MADIFGTDDLSVKDLSPLDTGNTRRGYNQCIASQLKTGKSQSEAKDICKKR